MKTKMLIILEYDRGSITQRDILDGILESGAGRLSLSYYASISPPYDKHSKTFRDSESFCRWLLRECVTRHDSPYYLDEYLHAMVDEWYNLTEGTSVLKKLDQVIQEGAAIKKERDALRGIKEDLERGLEIRENAGLYLDELIRESDTLRGLLRRIGHVDIRTRTIDKGNLEKALKQFYNYEAVQIEKVCVGSPDTATYMYPQKADPRLLLKVDIIFEEKAEEL